MRNRENRGAAHLNYDGRRRVGQKPSRDTPNRDAPKISSRRQPFSLRRLSPLAFQRVQREPPPGRSPAAAAPAAAGRRPTTAASRGCRWPDTRTTARRPRRRSGSRSAPWPARDRRWSRARQRPPGRRARRGRPDGCCRRCPTCARAASVGPPSRRGRSGRGCRSWSRVRSASRRRRAVDGRVRANLHVVFDDDDAVLRDLVMNAIRPGAKPKPSLPITAPSCTTTRARARPSRTETRACSTLSSPIDARAEVTCA